MVARKILRLPAIRVERTSCYLTTITFETFPSVVLPRNLLLLADSAVPTMAVALLKNSLFEIRITPAAFTPTMLLAKVLLATFIWQPALDRTAPLPPTPAPK